MILEDLKSICKLGLLQSFWREYTYLLLLKRLKTNEKKCLVMN